MSAEGNLIQVDRSIRLIATTIPASPGNLDSPSEGRPVWSFTDNASDATFKVHVPNNIESWADSPLAKLASAAILYVEQHLQRQIVYVVERDWPLSEDLHYSKDRTKSTSSWKRGDFFLALARVLVNGKLPSYQRSFSGAWAHGVATAVHHAVQHHIKGSTRHLRGTPKTLNAALGGTPWSINTPEAYRRIWGLVEFCLQTIPFEEGAAETWLRTQADLLGGVLKKGLKARRLGFLSSEESEFLLQFYKKGVSTYDAFIAKIKKPDEKFVFDFWKEMEAANAAVSEMENKVERLNTTRASALRTIKVKGKKKQSLQDKIAELPLGMYLKYFNPSQIDNVRPWHLTYESLVDHKGNSLMSIKDVKQEFNSWLAAASKSLGLSKRLDEVISAWFLSCALPRVEAILNGVSDS